MNGDGIKDLIVADLGNFSPTNEKLGKVVWLRGNADGTFTPFTLLEGVGRVADVQAADFNGDGKLDLVVAVFGFVMAYVWFKVSDLITPLRVSKETEIEGLDGPEMGVLGYPDFQLHPSASGAAALDVSSAAASSVVGVQAARKVVAD